MGYGDGGFWNIDNNNKNFVKVNTKFVKNGMLKN